jgi:glycerophosphoryl diester phosphodiesterase
MLVVCHDETLLRVQGDPSRVDALTAAQLAAFGVPTLAEVLALAGPRDFLDVELKVELGPSVVDVLAAGRGPTLRNAVVSSFVPAALDGVARRAPAWPRWLNTTSLDRAVVADAAALGCRGVSVQWRAVDAESVALAHEAGLEVAAWTVRRRPTFERLARIGIVAACVEAAALDG